MTDNSAVAADSEFLSERDRAHEIIKAGKLPTLGDLQSGAPFFGGSIVRDMRAWAQDWLYNSRTQTFIEQNASPERVAQIRNAVERLMNVCDVDAMTDVRAALDGVETSSVRRIDLYLACSADAAARKRAADAITERGTIWRISAMNIVLRMAVARGLMLAEHNTMPDYLEAGLHDLRQTGRLIARYDAAASLIEEKEAEEQDAKADELMRAVLGGDPDSERDAGDAWAPGLIVVPLLSDVGTNWRREINKGWRDYAGRPMPVVRRGDLAAQRRTLVERWPHAAEIIDIVLGDLAAREDVRFRPTLLVGEPGSGKSSLARAICETVSLPCELQSFAGVHDASMMGTSAQWSSARESVPLQLIKRAGKASVAVIWDEIEKVGTRRDNGSPLDALLPMLEPDQARRYRDLALEVEVDLSMVSHFATANSLDGVAAPVRDRMRVLTMPTPGWQHLSVLTKQIVDRVARERGIDPRWFQPLGEDEMDLIRSAWPGGSIRQLMRIVTSILDGRDKLLGKC